MGRGVVCDVDNSDLDFMKRICQYRTMVDLC